MTVNRGKSSGYKAPPKRTFAPGVARQYDPQSVNISDKVNMRNTNAVLKNDVTNCLFLPEKLLNAYRRARDLPDLEGVEVVNEAFYELNIEYLQAGGVSQSSKEVRDLWETAYSLAEVRRLRLERVKSDHRLGADKRQKKYEAVKTAASKLFWDRLPSHREWRTKSGKVRFGRAAAALAVELFMAHEQAFTSPDHPKIKGDGRLSYDNFEKTLAGWLRAAYKARST